MNVRENLFCVWIGDIPKEKGHTVYQSLPKSSQMETAINKEDFSTGSSDTYINADCYTKY